VLNKDVHDAGWSSTKRIFTSFYIGMYQPVTTQVYAFIYSIFGAWAPGFHAFSLLVHLVNIILVFLLVRSFSRNETAALITTALFAMSPMQVESVAWVSALSNLLYTAFYLSGLISYLRYIRQNKWPWLLYTFLFFALSVLSKPTAVTFPVMIYMLDLYYRRGLKLSTIFEKIPFLVVAITIGLVIIQAREQAGHIIDIAEHFSLGERALLLVYSLAFYISRLFVPAGLSAFHPYPAGTLPVEYFLAPLVPLMLAFLWWRLRAEPRRQTFVGIMFFLVAIAIVMEIIPVGTQVVKERYVYLPSVGIYYIFAMMLLFLTSGRRSGILLSRLIPVVFFVSFGILTFARAGVWHDSLSLWNDVLRRYPETSAAFINRGNAWLEREDLKRAVTDYTHALKYEPGAADAYLNRGLAYFRLQEPEKALPDFDRAIELGIDDAETYNTRGLLRVTLQDPPGAIADFDRAVSRDPGYAEAYINKGLVLANSASYRLAFNAFSEAIKSDPNSGRAYFWRGMVQQRMGLNEDACRDFRAAVQRGWPRSQVPPECGP